MNNELSNLTFNYQGSCLRWTVSSVVSRNNLTKVHQISSVRPEKVLYAYLLYVINRESWQSPDVSNLEAPNIKHEPSDIRAPEPPLLGRPHAAKGNKDTRGHPGHVALQVSPTRCRALSCKSGILNCHLLYAVISAGSFFTQVDYYLLRHNQ